MKVGDYVLATKYSDGDPQDQWAVGFYAGITSEHYTPPRYNVVDSNGQLFRHNGFRRIKKISSELGAWLVRNACLIEQSSRSIWSYARLSQSQRDEFENVNRPIDQ